MQIKPQMPSELHRRGKFLHYKELKKMIKTCRNDRQRGIDADQMEANDRRFFKQLQVEVKDINTCGLLLLIRAASLRQDPPNHVPSSGLELCRSRRQLVFQRVAPKRRVSACAQSIAPCSSCNGKKTSLLTNCDVSEWIARRAYHGPR
jgi:hypothetical protein